MECRVIQSSEVRLKKETQCGDRGLRSDPTISEALLKEVGRPCLEMDPTATIYSNEASMANGSNGESTLLMVTPQIVEEPETGLVPQAQAQPVAGLFGDQRIFVNAPQSHRHVQGAVSADDAAR